jgi:ABC-type lipoprotein release transport system permease subunit
MSWRNLFRNKRRSALIVAMITAGLTGVLFLSTIARGFSARAVNTAIENFLGHIQLHAPEYLDDPVATHSVGAEQSAAIFGQVRADGKLAGRIRVPAVVRSEYETRGAFLLGIDPAEESVSTFYRSLQIDGQGLAGPEERGILIGKKLADELQTGLGRRVVISATAGSEKVVERGFKIVGVFHIDPESREAAFIFTGRAAAQEMLGLGAGLSEISLTLSDSTAAFNSKAVDTEVDKLRRSFPGVDVQPWFKIEPLSHVIRTVQDGILRFMFTVVIGSIGFGLINALLMAVHERRREFAMLLALGMSPPAIIGQIVVELGLTLLVGALLGNSISYSLYLWVRPGIDLGNFAAGVAKFGVGKMIFPQMVTGDWIAANVIMVLVVLLSSLYPAYRAVRYDPVEALRK